jgi:predicted metal-dependent peptidase
MLDTAENKITKAKAKLIRNHPFFAILAFGADYIEAPWCKTMATDGKNIFWGRKFVDSITEKELMGVIAHEVLHMAWLHPLRLGKRNHKIWNIACDVVINETVLETKLALPKGGVYGPQYDKYKNWSANAVYEDLMKNAVEIKISFPSPDGQGDGEDDQGDEPTWGGIIVPMDGSGKPLTKDQISEIEEEMKIAVKQAAQAAKMRGKLPGSLEGLIEAVGKPKINWKEYIQNWVTGHHPDDFSWNRPNRKMFANYKIYMPRLKLNGAGHGVLSIDTSGSVSDNELREYVREIAGVIELCNPDKLTIIQHDAVITDVREWHSGEDFKNLHIKGRGGTCIQPSFQMAAGIAQPGFAGLDDPIDWMVCFTDMGICDYPSKAEAPDFPVLWCATGPDNAPFGTYLAIKDAIDG